MQQRKVLATGVSLLVACSVACSRHSSSPSSPSTASPTSANQAAGPSGETLKVTAPAIVSPGRDQVVTNSTPTLSVSTPTGLFKPTTLAYDFELYDENNVKTQTEIVATPNWTVKPLPFAKRFTWRARGTSDNAYGPWSPFSTFLTPDNTGYIRGNELFDPLTNGQTVGIPNGATFVPGVGIRLDGIESFVQYKLETPLTDGAFSVIITNLGNSNEQWKTKVMSMLQGDGVNITDNAYRFTADRRNADSGGAVRYTLRSRGVDAGEPNGGNASWSRSKLYYWEYSWINGRSNLLVKDGGPSGALVKNFGASYKAPYAPNPHIIRLGSVGGRAGSETLPAATFRNVWVSSQPRPSLPGDTP